MRRRVVGGFFTRSFHTKCNEVNVRNKSEIVKIRLITCPVFLLTVTK